MVTWLITTDAVRHVQSKQDSNVATTDVLPSVETATEFSLKSVMTTTQLLEMDALPCVQSRMVGIVSQVLKKHTMFAVGCVAMGFESLLKLLEKSVTMEHGHVPAGTVARTAVR
jgi:hypothetical protein